MSTIDRTPVTGPVQTPRATQVDEEPETVEAAEEELPTISHELANADHEEKGAVQIDHGQTEVRDLGWNDHPTDVPTPLVGGLPNEELWTLVRRFNKVWLGDNSFIKLLNALVANVPCQSPARTPAWRTRPQYCRRRRILSR